MQCKYNSQYLNYGKISLKLKMLNTHIRDTEFGDCTHIQSKRKFEL